jgi:nitroreductase
MQTWDAIRARRNVRSYQTTPVPDADLNRIAEAAWRAPSASNRQHWDFVIVTDPDRLRALSAVWRGAGHIAGAAAAIALVVPRTDDERTRLLDYYDLGQATYAMTLAAADLGIAPATHRSATRTRPARSSAYPAITTWPSCSAWATRPIGPCVLSPSRTAVRSARSSIAAGGNSAPCKRRYPTPKTSMNAIANAGRG